MTTDPSSAIVAVELDTIPRGGRARNEREAGVDARDRRDHDLRLGDAGQLSPIDQARSPCRHLGGSMPSPARKDVLR